MESDLRTLRKQAGLSQKQLSELSGVAQSNISAYESGRRTASPAMLQRLSEAMIRPSERLRQHRHAAHAIITRLGGRNPRVFGSIARGTDTPKSDVDLLVSVPPEAAWGFLSLSRELEELLGVPVHVVSEGGLKDKHVAILAEAIPL